MNLEQSPEYHGFLDALRKQSTHAHWLIFADWLEEKGEILSSDCIRNAIAIVKGEGEKKQCPDCYGSGIVSTSRDPVRHRGSARGAAGRRPVSYRQSIVKEDLCRRCNASGWVIDQQKLYSERRRLYDELFAVEELGRRPLEWWNLLLERF